MEVNLTTEQVSMYAHIVATIGEQFCTYQNGVFYFNYGMEDYVDAYGIIFNTKANSIFIEDAAWSDEQLNKVYSVIGYARYHGISVAGIGL